MSALLTARRPRVVRPAQRGITPGGFTLAAAVLGFFVITFDAVVVNIALPPIRSDLGGGITGLQWIADGYTLMFAALLLSAGSLSDRLGARRTFAAGLSAFVAASAACGLAPVLGGLLSAASWRLIFFVNVPAGAVALILLRRTAPSPRRPVPFDWAGQVTAVLAMGGLTYGAIEAGVAGFAAARVVAAFAIAVTALAAFAVIEARGAHPMVPPALFRYRAVPAAVAIGFAFVVGYYGLPFVMSLYLQEFRGLSPLAAGVAFLPYC